MDGKQFVLQDINEELENYIDKYMKTVIINAKRRFFRQRGRQQKCGIVFVELEEYEPYMSYLDPAFDKIDAQYIQVLDIDIPVYNPALAEALCSITELQRTVLVGNVVLKMPIKTIAQKLEISERMVKKHKQRAIENIRRRLFQNEKS